MSRWVLKSPAAALFPAPSQRETGTEATGAGEARPASLPLHDRIEAPRRLSDAFQPRGNVDAVPHQVAIALLDNVAEVLFRH